MQDVADSSVRDQKPAREYIAANSSKEQLCVAPPANFLLWTNRANV
jgi:hypothetical protein